LHKNYPQSKFTREDVALLILQEEAPIYSSLKNAVPKLDTYVKPIVAFKYPKKRQKAARTF